MALQKQEINVNLSQPLNTKLDEKVLPENFVAASENIDYVTPGTCKKRKGLTQKTTSVSSGSFIGARFVDTLDSIGNKLFCSSLPLHREVFTYSEGEDEWQKVVSSRPISYTANDVSKTDNKQLWVDSDYQEYGSKPFACYAVEKYTSGVNREVDVILEDVNTGFKKSVTITANGLGSASVVPASKPRIRFSKGAVSSTSDMSIFVTYKVGANMNYVIYDVDLSISYTGTFASLTANQTFSTNYDVIEDNSTLYIFALTTAGNNLVTQALTSGGVTTSTATTAVTAYNTGAFISACKSATKYCVFYNVNKKTDDLLNINYTDMTTVANSVSTIVSGVTFKYRNFSCIKYSSANGDIAFIAQNQVDDPTGTTIPPEDRLLLYGYNSNTQAISLAKEIAYIGNPSKPLFYDVGTFNVLIIAGSHYRNNYVDNNHDFLFFTDIDNYFDCIGTFNRGNGIGLPTKYTIAGGADTIINNPNNLVLNGEFVHSAFLSLNKLDFDNSSKIFGTKSYTFQLTARDDLRTNDKFGKCIYYPGAYSYMYDGESLSENNFLYRPIILEALAAGSAASLADGTYKFKAVYETQLPNGVRAQSAPSSEVTYVVSGGGGTANIEINISNYNIGQKATNENSIVSLYATDKDGSVFYKVNEANIGTTTGSVSFTFGSVSGITNNLILYTESGELENSALPPSNYILSAKNRLFSINREDPNIINYTKRFIDNFEAEYSDTLNIRIDNKTQLQGATALAHLDEKIIIFKRDRIFYFVGDGPTAIGTNNTFSVPELITSDIGCFEPTSVIRIPTGIMFKSDKGIYILNRGLSIEYIGNPVEEFNNIPITSAILNEDKNHVRFTLQNTGMLVYDYFIDRWSIYKDVSATDSCQLNGVQHYLKSSEIFYDGTGYQDDGNYYSMKVITPWFKVTGIQNFGRIWRAFVLGKFKSAHELVVKTYYDYNNTATDTYVLNPDVADSQYQEEIHLRIQKCQAVKFEIYDQTQSGTGESMELTDLTLLVGRKRGPFKLPSTQKN